MVLTSVLRRLLRAGAMTEVVDRVLLAEGSEFKPHCHQKRKKGANQD
jgi:hypothetical protein